MTADHFRPVVAIEVHGLLGFPLPPNVVTLFTESTGAEIIFRRDAFPTRFLAEPHWDSAGKHVERWAFLGRGVRWVEEVLAQGIEVVWASRYQHVSNLYFSSPLGLPELPIATLDDGRLHATEADWKASQLGQETYDGRPLLWINDELTMAGRFLLDRWRKRADWPISLTRYIPDAASDGDVTAMNNWLELAQSESGHAELRRLRARFMAVRRGRDFSTDVMHREWVEVRKLLDAVVDFRSGLAAPLAAYAVEHIDGLDVGVVAQIREDWGLSVDPSAEELFRLLARRSDH